MGGGAEGGGGNKLFKIVIFSCRRYELVLRVARNRDTKELVFLVQNTISLVIRCAVTRIPLILIAVVQAALG